MTRTSSSTRGKEKMFESKKEFLLDKREGREECIVLGRSRRRSVFVIGLKRVSSFKSENKNFLFPIKFCMQFKQKIIRPLARIM